METDSEQCAVQSRHLAGGTAAARVEQQSPQQELSTKPAQGTARPKPGSHLRRNKQTDPNEQTNKTPTTGVNLTAVFLFGRFPVIAIRLQLL